MVVRSKIRVLTSSIKGSFEEIASLEYRVDANRVDSEGQVVA